MPSQGVVYVAYGDKAQQEAAYSIDTLRESNPGTAVAVISDYRLADMTGIQRLDPYEHYHFFDLTNAQKARYRKVHLYEYTPFDYTLYVDADTRIYGDLSPIFDILRDGWELVITPGQQYGDEWLWHVDKAEREYTAESIGYYAQVLAGGVFGFRKTEAVELFFKYWQADWYVYKGEDQAALLRALYASPVCLWLLGKPFNGAPGAVVSHLFGRTREAK